MRRDFRHFDNDFKKKYRKANKSMDGQLPRVLGNEHKIGFRRSFRQKSFYDHGSKKWSDPKRKDTGSAFPPPTRSHITRQTLVGKAGAGGSGLQDSFRVIAGKNKVTIENTKEYAAIHNEGGKHKIRVTKKFRKFCWAMYYKAKARGANNYESWKNLALTKKTSLTVTIPQRQFMGHSRKIDENCKKEIDEELNKIM